MLVYLNREEHEAGCQIQNDVFVIVDVPAGNYDIEFRFCSSRLKWSSAYEGPTFKTRVSTAQRVWVPVVVPHRFDPIQEHGVAWQVERRVTTVHYSTTILGGSLLAVVCDDKNPVFKWTHSGLSFEGNVFEDTLLDVLQAIRERTIHYVTRAHRAIAPHIQAEARPKSGMVECKRHQCFYDVSLGCKDCAAMGLRS